MRIASNVASKVAQGQMKKVSRQVEKSLIKTATQSRIVNAAYDPAGLAISERLKSHIKSYGQAMRNANDSISIVQVAEGYLSTINALGIRFREIAMQAATDTISEDGRKLMQFEIKNLMETIEQSLKVSSFGGKSLREVDEFVMQIGIRNNPNEDRFHYRPKEMIEEILQTDVLKLDVSKKEKAQNSLEIVDNFIEKVSKARTKLGSVQTRLSSIVTSVGISNENTSAGNSRIRDLDMAKESTQKAKLLLRNEATGMAIKTANVRSNEVLRLIS